MLGRGLRLFTGKKFARGYASNRGVAYIKPGVVEVQPIAYPKLELAEQKRKCDHGVILKVIYNNFF